MKNDETKELTIDITEEFKASYQKEADKRGITLNEMMVIALGEYLKTPGLQKLDTSTW